MPQLHPIRAIRYAGQGDLTTKIAPPYDVLDEGPKRELLARDPYNIVAIDLPVTPPKTVGPDDAYDAAGAMFRQWLADGVLSRDDKPAVFAYEQVFELDGRPQRRRGLFAALGVEEFNRPGGGIFRHEYTIRGGTDDRLKLMRATAAQLSPVFAIYEDPDRRVRGLIENIYASHAQCTGRTMDDGVEHRLWMIHDAKVIDELGKAFAMKDVFIADGHHRYTTALNYHREHPENPAAAACLFVLVAAEDPGLMVRPTHRVMAGMEGFSFDRFRAVIEADGYFELSALAGNAQDIEQVLRTLPSLGPHAVAVYDATKREFWVLSTKEADPLGDIAPSQPPVWRKLDVAILHELLVDRTLRPHFGGAAITYLYPHVGADVVKLCHAAPGRLGIVMQPTPLQSVFEVARAGGVMPPKSTFFYPKLATGLVINPLK